MPPKKYVKMDPIEHVLKRSDMYIGSTSLKKIEEYVTEETSYNIIKKEITSSPALLRIFIEILSNAIDNVERSRKTKTPVTKISVKIDSETGETSVWNDGQVIPIEKNDDGKYFHSMVFGELLTGSNYDDEEERVISGRNGLGCKLTSIFSSEFTVEGYDSDKNKKLVQKWTNNMNKTNGPKITIPKGLKTGYTKVTWTPDFKRFKLRKYTKDIISLYTRYVIDAAMLTKQVKVYLNSKLIKVDSLYDYSKLYSNYEDFLYIKTKNTELLLTPSSEYEHISFVNGVYTRNGGVHVDCWSEALFRPIVDKFNSKKNSPKININDVRQFFRLFVVSTVIRPTFEGQEKTRLESPNVDADVKQTHISKIMKWKVIENIEQIIKSKEYVALKKAEKVTKGSKIEGYDRANKAGDRYGSECSLFITEGLSAKTYVVSGIKKGLYGKSGRDWNGILPIRGKLLNVRDKTAKMVAGNKIICNIIQALGLKHGVNYKKTDNYEKLNYGRLVIVADADCFTYDTPVIIKKDGKIDVVLISSLSENWINDNSLIEDTEIWSSNGWTKLLAVKRKIVDKKTIAINTPSGYVKCSEDHPIYINKNEKVLAKELKVGDKILTRKQFINTNNEFKISIIESWIFGLFFSHGFCDFNNLWYIDNCDIEVLEKSKNILKSIYPENYYDIIKIENNCYRLFLVSGSIKSWRKMFYDTKYKKVPSVILNSSNQIKESFLHGVNKYYDNFDIVGQIGAQGLCIILENLNYHYTIDKRSESVYTIDYSGKVKKDENVIKSIEIVDYEHKYYYDVETEIHNLNAGIGQIITSNCDGIHIEGLLLNFIHCLYPSLLQRKVPFVVSMKTPIARIGKTKIFYDERRFIEWMRNNEKVKKSSVKYYKGLGTTKPEDVKDTFGLKMVEFKNDTKAMENMEKAFNKKYSNDRKKWLAEYNPNETKFSLDNDGEIFNMNISDFVNNELIKFSHSDCARSIPNGIDGLKESQRKILYAVKKRNLTYGGKSLKVAQLAGYTAEHSNYHHGEKNLFDTIIGMAHDFVGSNNIPILYRDGQFGSRLEGGKDAADGRYIFTKMDKLTELIYRKEDEPLLTQVTDDGDKVQPEFYVPIIPMILVNGITAGIGTGWSCKIPCYNPVDMIEAIKSWLNKEKYKEYKPYYKNFKGTIEKCDEKYKSYGVIKKAKTGNKYSIEELPIQMWTTTFSEFCDDLKTEKKLKSVSNFSSPTEVSFSVTPAKDFFCNLDSMKMSSYLYTSNMVLFDEKGQISKYDTIYDIINKFCEVRYEYYIRRKKYQIECLEKEIRFLSNKQRFISEIYKDELIVMKRSESKIVEDLSERGYDKHEDSYDYLLKISIRFFTKEKIDELEKSIRELKKKMSNIKKKSEKEMWIDELNILEAKI